MFSLFKVHIFFITPLTYVLICTEILVQFSYLNFVFPVPLFHIPPINWKKDEFNPFVS